MDVLGGRAARAGTATGRPRQRPRASQGRPPRRRSSSRKEQSLQCAQSRRFRRSEKLLESELEWQTNNDSQVKRLEAKQGWIDREVQRLEAESAAAASVQGNLKIRQEKLRAEVEEVRKRRLEIIQENSDTDLNKSDIPTPESMGDVRDLESKELNFRRAVAKNTRRT